MSAHVELEQAVRLHRAEERWLDQCADRLRRASSPRSTPPAATEATEAATRETVR